MLSNGSGPNQESIQPGEARALLIYGGLSDDPFPVLSLGTSEKVRRQRGLRVLAKHVPYQRDLPAQPTLKEQSAHAAISIKQLRPDGLFA